MTRSRNVADVQANGVSAVPNVVAGKNAIINGGFDIFQRGTFSAGANGYALDRWFIEAGGGTTTVTQQTTGAPSGSRYVMRVACAQTGAYANAFQFIETSNALTLAGKTVTVSALVRRNSSYTANLTLRIEKNATVDAGYATASWVVLADSTIANANIPTGTTASDWAKVTATVTIPNDGTANSLRVNLFESATQTNGAYKEFAQVQLEVGSQATPFSRAGGTIQGELAACQRYYATSIPDGYTTSNFPIMGTVGAGGVIFTCSQGGTNDLFGTIQYPVPLRSAPTFNIYSGNNRTSGSVRDMVTGSDLTVGSYAAQSGSNRNYTYMGVGSYTSNRQYGFHYTANAEL